MIPGLILLNSLVFLLGLMLGARHEAERQKQLNRPKGPPFYRT